MHLKTFSDLWMDVVGGFLLFQLLCFTEKKFYDDLWEQDRQKKIAKEEADKQRHREMNIATVAMLEAQLEALRKQAMEEERLKKEEAVLMVSSKEKKKKSCCGCLVPSSSFWYFFCS
jgi:hypothetical protein